MYLAGAGDYADPSDRRQVLAMRVETLVSAETSNWVASQQEQIAKAGDRTAQQPTT